MSIWVGRGALLAAAICMTAATATAQQLIPADTRPTQLAQAQTQARAPTAASSGESNTVAKVNNWTVGLAGGLPEGTFLRFGAEISRNLNDSDDLRVLTIVTPGATDNVKDLLYLKGIDIAITHADVFEHFRNVEKIPNIEKRVNFISEMYISELHVLVRPEINSFKDLNGKKVSFHTPGAGPSVTGPILFQRLGIKVEPVYVNNAIAYEKMKTGEIAALIHTVGKPNDLFTKNKNEHGFKFLAVPFDKFDDFYVPSVFTDEDYPGYVKPGEKVETLGVQAVLAVYNWPRESDRFRRVSRFIDYYFDRFENFHAARITRNGRASTWPPRCRAGPATGSRRRSSSRWRRRRRRARVTSLSTAAGAPAGRARLPPTMRPSRSACSSSSWSGASRKASSDARGPSQRGESVRQTPRASRRAGNRARLTGCRRPCAATFATLGAMTMPVRWQLAPATRGGIATAMRGKGLALAALAALTATVAFAAEGRTQRPEARIVVAQTIVAEAPSQTAVQIQTGPSEAIPANSFIRLRGLPRQRFAVGRLRHRAGLLGHPAAEPAGAEGDHPGRRLGPLRADHQPGQRRRQPCWPK